MSEGRSMDSLTLAVVEARLNALNQELGARLFRQCFSVPTSHIRDVGTVLFDSNERTLSVGNFMPVHTGGSHVSLKGMLDWIGRENIRPDDFIIGNDPFIVKFGHLADWSFLRPIFYEGELVLSLAEPQGSLHAPCIEGVFAKAGTSGCETYFVFSYFRAFVIIIFYHIISPLKMYNHHLRPSKDPNGKMAGADTPTHKHLLAAILKKPLIVSSIFIIT